MKNVSFLFNWYLHGCHLIFLFPHHVLNYTWRTHLLLLPIIKNDRIIFIKHVIHHEKRKIKNFDFEIAHLHFLKISIKHYRKRIPHDDPPPHYAEFMNTRFHFLFFWPFFRTFFLCPEVVGKRIFGKWKMIISSIFIPHTMKKWKTMEIRIYHF